MCLIAIAHRVSPPFPLVIAANRDEDYGRASRAADFWREDPRILGGRDEVAGGSWLAVTRSGRFAAVTNLRGAMPKSRSRGALVTDFVRSDVAPDAYASEILQSAADYAGFHLLAGEAGSEVMYVTPQNRMPLASGVHSFSNAPEGEVWPKTEIARDEMQRAIQNDDAESLIDVLLQFLTTSRGTDSVESEVFIRGDRYGTRASTVIVATPDEIFFAEQSFARGGEPQGERRLFRFGRAGGGM